MNQMQKHSRKLCTYTTEFLAGMRRVNMSCELFYFFNLVFFRCHHPQRFIIRILRKRTRLWKCNKITEHGLTGFFKKSMAVLVNFCHFNKCNTVV